MIARAILTLALATGCGPLVVWHGRSPDRAHRAVIVDEGGRQRLVVDGEASEPYEAVGFTHLSWTARGAVVPVRTGGLWRMMSHGDLGPAYDAIGEIVTAGDRVAYAAQDRAGWRVVDRGVPGPVFESLRAGSLAIDGERLLYVARSAGGEHVVIDGEVGPAYERIGALGTGAKGTLTGYVGVHGAGADVIVDGRVVMRAGDVRELVLAKGEPRWAAIVEGDGERSVVHGARTFPSRTAEQLVLSDDGTRVAWIALAPGAAEVWLDGARVGSHLGVERMRFVPRTGALIYVAREAEGVRVVHDGARGPRLRTVESLVVSQAGHVGYVGTRGVGSVVVIDGALRYRGEWAGGLVLAERSEGFAFLVRDAGRRFVVTSERRVELARPFVDTLVLAPDGARWAVAVADPRTRRLDVVVDGVAVAPLDVDEVSAARLAGGDPVEVVRAIVRGELTRAIRRSRAPAG